MGKGLKWWDGPRLVDLWLSTCEAIIVRSTFGWWICRSIGGSAWSCWVVGKDCMVSSSVSVALWNFFNKKQIFLCCLICLRGLYVSWKCVSIEDFIRWWRVAWCIIINCVLCGSDELRVVCCQNYMLRGRCLYIVLQIIWSNDRITYIVLIWSIWFLFWMAKITSRSYFRWLQSMIC